MSALLERHGEEGDVRDKKGGRESLRVCADCRVLALVDVVVQLLDGGCDNTTATRGASGHDELSVAALHNRRADGRLRPFARPYEVDGTSRESKRVDLS